jgi:IS5 family transposase
MLRLHCIANGFNLADEACEDALYDVPALRDFCRIDLGRERVCHRRQSA